MRFFICIIAVIPFALALPGSEDEYYDIFGDGKKEWRLAFRGTARVGSSVYSAYTTTTDVEVDAGCKGVDWTAACKAHYRNNDALDNWAMVKEVVLAVIKDGAMVKTIKFDGTDSNPLSWFRNSRLGDSCYKDIKTRSKNYFSIAGAEDRRRFFINHKYGGCPNDIGWFVAIDVANTGCGWEKFTQFPVFKYAAGPAAVNWNDEGANEADAMVIFLRYLPHGGDIHEYFDVFGSGKREWRLAFRATADVGVPVYEAYVNGKDVPETVEDCCKSTNWGEECKSHYRNDDAIDNWNKVQIDQVLFGVVDDGALVKTITFDGKNTDKFTWFQQAKVIDSCWSDFGTLKNFFGIIGHRAWPVIQRTFFVNQAYGGCPKDVGWVVAVDNAPKPPCPWEQNDAVPYLLYAAGNTKSNWLDRSVVKEADAFVIFIKYKTTE